MVNQGIHVMSVTVRRSYVKPLGTVGRILKVSVYGSTQVKSKIDKILTKVTVLRIVLNIDGHLYLLNHTKALYRSVFSPNGAGSGRWRGQAVPVLAVGEDHRLLGTDQR